MSYRKIILSFILAVALLGNGLSLSKDKTSDNTMETTILEYTKLKSLIDSDMRLFQHVVAIKYSKLPPTKENIKAFLKEAKCINPEVSFQTALRETGNGKAGVGKPPYNNHFGMKRANKRFTWANGYKSNGYAIYASAYFSYLDFQEFQIASIKKTGHVRKSWQKKTNKFAVGRK